MKYIDLFAGAGGLSLGLHMAGLRGVFAVERNKDAFETLKYNLIDKKSHFEWPEWLDQKNWDILELLEKHSLELSNLKGNVDLVVGGPPCQGFSMAGKRQNDDVRNQLMHSYIEIVRLVQPKFLFFENVQGFTVDFKGEDTSKNYSNILLEKLKKLGYKVECQIITMSEFGVPQNRKRFILFASKDELKKSFFDILTHNRDAFLKERRLKLPITVSQAIDDLKYEHGVVDSQDTKNFKNGTYGKANSSYQRLMKKNLVKKAIPDSHRFAKHRQETVDLFERLMQASDKVLRITPKMNLVEGLKKRGVTPLKEKSVCNTITSIPDDYIHYAEPRIMTVREHARIQSFPDEYAFKGPYTTGGERRKIDVPRYTQVANAVPPLFAEQVGKVIMSL
ncbi:DNA cytosine methyltransferase [Streptococcus suis]|uniref:DNA cytosine methyltransferase n=1 Tax=Streptococcus suis TaxID=1307 RepID=UPI000E0B3BA8|nr:DNA cytosine methyltransferase [Streptococcus suis]AXI66968.1 DNA cytosine methyltransferase [Streptococcus suis]NQI35404.1 DNA cytosine methyltransferase [Streptococcus suis]NQI37823.1 DNA cytosine methyltransferase [Streptococcus suis]NQI47820.1 DNA cytosine methyltransferase [Streptococcus suis]HEL2651574.1 DNA cytosine methyltransferase [Streptococcus suis]